MAELRDGYQIEITSKDVTVNWGTGTATFWLRVEVWCPAQQCELVEHAIHTLCDDRFKDWGGSIYYDDYGQQSDTLNVSVREKLLSVAECLGILTD